MAKSKFSKFHEGDNVEFRYSYKRKRWVGGVVQQVTNHNNHIRYVIMDADGRVHYLVEEEDVRGLTERTITALMRRKVLYF